MKKKDNKKNLPGARNASASRAPAQAIVFLIPASNRPTVTLIVVAAIVVVVVAIVVVGHRCCGCHRCGCGGHSSCRVVDVDDSKHVTHTTILSYYVTSNLLKKKN